MNILATIVILSRYKPTQVYADLLEQTYKNFQIIWAKEDGIVNAMNKALSQAKGEIFVRIDDDVRLPVEWLETLVAPFNDPEVAGVTGPTFVPKDRRKLRDSIRIAEKPNLFLNWLFDHKEFAPAAIYKCGSVSYDSNYFEKFYARGGDDLDSYEPAHLEGTNWAMRTHLIREVGGFDPKFDGVSEWFDTDVEMKIKKLGYKFAYNYEAYLWHMLEQGDHYAERFQGFGRIKNWLRFHVRHSKFHPKMVIWFLMMVGYTTWKNCQLLFRR